METRQEPKDGFIFASWLRTGRVIRLDTMGGEREVKFNPNHDPKDGRFTFRNGGGAGTSRSANKRAAASVDRPQPVKLKDGNTVPNPNSPTGVLMQPLGVSLEKT